MSTPISIPRLGVGMTEGVLVSWLVEDGDHVESGTSIYLLETEKVENEVEAVVAGTITLLAEAGGTYPVGAVIGEIT